MELNVKTLATSLLGVIIAIVVCVAVFVPITGIYDESQQHINDRIDYAKYVPADGEYVLENDGTANHWTLNGQAWTKPGGGANVATMAYADSGNIIIVANWNGAQVTNGFSAQPKYVISGGNFTSYNSSGEQIYQTAWPGGWVRSVEKTDYVFSDISATKYVEVDTGANWAISAYTNTNLFFRITGNISAMDLTVTEINGKAVTINSVEYSGPGHSGGYFQWDKISVNYTYQGNTSTFVLSTVVIPEVAVSAEKSEVYSSLFGILPLIVIIGIVLATVGTFIRNRD